MGQERRCCRSGVVVVALATLRSYFSIGIMNDDLLSHPASLQ
jgi:hypothetical protein